MAGAQNSFVWYELMSSDVAAAKAFGRLRAVPPETPRAPP
jgi:hypothetical protein